MVFQEFLCYNIENRDAFMCFRGEPYPLEQVETQAVWDLTVKREGDGSCGAPFSPDGMEYLPPAGVRRESFCRRHTGCPTHLR